MYSDHAKIKTFIGPYQPNTVIQLASNTPGNFVAAVRKILAYDTRYEEFNLNCGCPSGKLKNAYGAALMAYPEYGIY